MSSFSSMLSRAVADEERWLGLSSFSIFVENLLSFFATAGSSISLILRTPGILCLEPPFTIAAFSFARSSLASFLTGRSSKSSSGTPGPCCGRRKVNKIGMQEQEGQERNLEKSVLWLHRPCGWEASKEFKKRCLWQQMAMHPSSMALSWLCMAIGGLDMKC